MPIIEGAVAVPILNPGAPVAAVNEVQLLTYTATGAGSNVATAGAFVLNFQGHRTAALAFNVSAADMQTALLALGSIGAAGCSVTVAAGPPRVYTVTFDGGNLAGVALPLITVESNTLVDAAAIAVDVIATESVAGVTATQRGAATGAILYDTVNNNLYINTGTALVPVWTSLGVVTTTSTAAELNFNDTAVAGTAVASKTAVLGADKELDEFHTAALYLGAAAGTLVAATAAEINKKIAAAGHAADGLGVLGVARFTYDPTATAGMRTQAAHDLGVTLPQHAIVVGGFVDVNTAFSSTNGTATVAISVEGANDIISAAQVNGAPFSTIGRKAIVPKANTPESTSVKTTAARAITATVGTEALLGGKLTGFLYYVVSAASA
jgi:hypothetical protein